MRNDASPGMPPGRALPRRALRAGALALLAVAAAACQGGLPGPRAAATGDTLRLGLPLPQTDGAGTPDVYGENARLGAELAQREINAAGGIGGRPVGFHVLDDEGGAAAIAVAAELAASDAVAVVGHVYSGATLRAAEIYTRAELPAVATTATSPDISAAGPWVFRVASSDSANAVQLARVARDLGPRAETLYVNDDYGRGLARVFDAAFRAGGGTITGTAPYLEDTPDFAPYLERLRGRGVSTVFLAGTDVGASRLIAQAQRMGIGVRFLGGDGIEALTGRGAAYDGTLVGTLFHRDASPRAAAFADAYRAAFRRDPDSAAALTYDAVHLLAKGLGEGHTSRRALRRWLETVGVEGGAPAFEGAAGRVAFDAAGDPRDKQFFVGSISDGGIQLSRGVQ